MHTHIYIHNDGVVIILVILVVPDDAYSGSYSIS